MTVDVKSMMCASKMRTPRHWRCEAPCETVLLDQMIKQANPAPAPNHQTENGADYPHPPTPCRHVRWYCKGRETEVDTDARCHEDDPEHAREQNQMGQAVLQREMGVESAFDPQRPAMSIGIQRPPPFSFWEHERTRVPTSSLTDWVQQSFGQPSMRGSRSCPRSPTRGLPLCGRTRRSESVVGSAGGTGVAKVCAATSRGASFRRRAADSRSTVARLASSFCSEVRSKRWRVGGELTRQIAHQKDTVSNRWPSLVFGEPFRSFCLPCVHRVFMPRSHAT